MITYQKVYLSVVNARRLKMGIEDYIISETDLDIVRKIDEKENEQKGVSVL